MSLSILLFFAVIFGLIMMTRMARIGALVAFLAAGMLAGPYLLNLFQLTDTWEFLGDMGILFLWFNIGLEINMKRLWGMRRTIFGLGFAQVMMVAVMLFPILYGITSWSMIGAIMVSLILAMSSTSGDLQLLGERNEMNTDMGRQTFSILLFQDLLSIPLLAMLPVLAGKSINLGATAIDVLVMSVGLVLGVTIVGRFILNPLMKLVCRLKSREAFLLAVMLNIIFWAYVLGQMGLPVGLGAFLAGMLLSETIYRHQVAAEVAPYATLFLAMFFIALGVGLDLPFLVSHWYLVLGGLVGLIVIKFIAIYIVARVRHVSSQDARKIALILAQGGEFGLLILQTMKTGGIDAVPAMQSEIITAIIILSIMATPLLMWVHDWMMRRGMLCGGAAKKQSKSDAPRPDVIICGFGRVGHIVAQMLAARGISYVALDMNVDTVMQGRARGFNVCYGNTTHADVLREFGLAARKTRAVVVALDNETTARNTVATVRTIAPRVRIFARARNLAESRQLMSRGVAGVFPETIESSLLLARGVLVQLGVSESRVDAMVDEMRANNYAAVDPAVDYNFSE